LENFWKLFKRGIDGTSVSVEPSQLFRHLDERTFRYNNCNNEDGDACVFQLALSRIVGRMLRYEDLIGLSEMESKGIYSIERQCRGKRIA
jgi:hypothetical protein